MYFNVLKILFLHRKIYSQVLKVYFHVLKFYFHVLKKLSSNCEETILIRFQKIVWPEMIKNCLRFRSKPVHPLVIDTQKIKSLGSNDQLNRVNRLNEPSNFVMPAQGFNY